MGARLSEACGSDMHAAVGIALVGWWTSTVEPLLVGLHLRKRHVLLYMLRGRDRSACRVGGR